MNTINHSVEYFIQYELKWQEIVLLLLVLKRTLFGELCSEHSF